MSPDLREVLAAYAHGAWAGWMRYQFAKAEQHADGSLTIPAWAFERWTRQAATAYADLPEHEKASDRAEADRIITLVAQVQQADAPGHIEDTHAISWNGVLLMAAIGGVLGGALGSIIGIAYLMVRARKD